MKQLVPITSLICLLWAASAAAPAGAEQWLTRDPLSAEAFVDFDGERRKNSETSTNFDLQEGVRVRQSGFALDPLIAKFSADGRIVFQQGRLSGFGQDENRKGFFADYDVNLSVLHGTPHPFSATARVARDSGTLDTNLGGRNDYINKTREVTIFSKNRYFPSFIRYTERDQDTTFRSAFSNSSGDRKDSLKRLAFSGRSSKLNVTVEHDWFDDQSTKTDRDYRETRAQANHNVKWGRGSRASSRLLYWDRRGDRSRQRLDVDELVNIQHSSKLQSYLRYRFTHLTQDTTSVSHNGSVEFAHRVFSNLTSRVRAYGTWLNSDDSDETDYEARFNLEYAKTDVMAGGGDVNISAGVGYGVTDRVSLMGFSEAIGETQTVPTSGIILLNQRFIDAGSIIVTDDTGTIVYEDGADYTISEASGGFTELTIIFGGQISVGQALLIDYRFDTLPSLKYSRVPYEFRVLLDYGWISFSHRMIGESQEPISGRDGGLLLDRKDIATGVELRWDRPNSRATFGVERRVLDTGAFASKSINLRQTYFRQLTETLSFNVSAGEDFIKSSGRDIQLYSADARITWRPTSGLVVRPFATTWIRRDHAPAGDLTGDVNDRFTSAGLEVTWQIRRLKFRARYNHDDRSGTRIDTSEDRLMFHLVRGF